MSTTQTARKTPARPQLTLLPSASDKADGTPRTPAPVRASQAGSQRIGEVWGFRIGDDPLIDLIRGTFWQVAAHIVRVSRAFGQPVEGPIPVWDVIYTPESHAANVLTGYEEVA
jgi:hypothetical protein